MKKITFLQLFSFLVLLLLPTLTSAQAYLALYEDNSYKVIDQNAVDDMLAIRRHPFKLPMLVFRLDGNVPTTAVARPVANGAGTRLASTQASTKPGLKSSIVVDPNDRDDKVFEILCSCREGYYVSGLSNGAETNCKESCATAASAVSKEMMALSTYFHNQGIDISK